MSLLEIGLKENTQFCSFRMGEKLFAVDIIHIIEIVRWRAPTPIPRAPEFIEGYLDLRGAIIPIMDLKKRLESASTESNKRTRIVVLRIDRQVLGFIIEEVLDIFTVPEGGLRPAPPISIEGVSHDFLKAVYNGPEGMFLMLDIKRLLSSQEHQALKTIKAAAPR